MRNGGRTSGASAPFFAFAPSSGAGLPSASTLCSTWASLDPSPTQSGCYDATTNTMTTGGPWVTWGSGTTTSTDTYIPDGPSGSSKASQRVTTAGGWTATTAITNNTSGLTACWLGVLDVGSTTTMLISHENGGSPATIAWELAAIGSAVTATVSDGVASVSPTKAGLVSGALHFACMTWSAAAGAEACLDGSCSAGIAKASMTALSAKPTFNGRNGTASSSQAQRGLGWFFSSTRLSDAQILTLSNAVLARSVTGAKGEALTFTRASTAFCEQVATDGGLWGGAGTMVPSNVPCVTGGGLRVEAAQAGTGNLVVRSQELDNAAWGKVNGGAGTLPVVTQDYAVAPDGTKTAERVQVSACPSNGVDYSVVRQIPTTATGNHVGSFYVKGTSGSGTIAVVIYDSNSATGAWKACPYVSTEWRRCDSGLKSFGATANNQLQIGCNYASAVYAGSSDTGAADVLVWGAQLEGASLTSYMPTAGAAAARAIESMRTTGTYAVTGTNLGSMAITAQSYNVPNPQNLSIAIVGGNDYESLYSSGGANVVYDMNLQTRTTGALVTPLPHRFAGYTDGTNIGACYDGSCTTAARTGSITNGARTIWLGVNSIGTSPTNGIIKQVCYDPDPSRCR